MVPANTGHAARTQNGSTAAMVDTARESRKSSTQLRCYLLIHNVYVSCVAGYERDSSGNCVKICSWGQIRDSSGRCTDKCTSPEIPDYNGVSDF